MLLALSTIKDLSTLFRLHGITESVKVFRMALLYVRATKISAKLTYI